MKNYVNDQLKITYKVLIEYRKKNQYENDDNINYLEEVKKRQQRAISYHNTTLGDRKEVRRL